MRSKLPLLLTIVLFQKGLPGDIFTAKVGNHEMCEICSLIGRGNISVTELV